MEKQGLRPTQFSRIEHHIEICAIESSVKVLHTMPLPIQAMKRWRLPMKKALKHSLK